MMNGEDQSKNKLMTAAGEGPVPSPVVFGKASQGVTSREEGLRHQIRALCSSRWQGT